MNEHISTAHRLLRQADRVHREPMYPGIDTLAEGVRRDQQALGLRLAANVHAITALIETEHACGAVRALRRTHGRRPLQARHRLPELEALMASCSTPGCGNDHGIVNELCHDHLRWRESFTAEEIATLDWVLTAWITPAVEHAPGLWAKAREMRDQVKAATRT